MKNIFSTAAILLIGLMLVGCPIVGPATGLNTILVVNESTFVITEIYISPVDSPEWGPNLLGDPLLPGETTTIFAADDCYDFLAVSYTGDYTGNSTCLYGGEVITWTFFNTKSIDGLESSLG